ncbi:hypothetical protein MPDQ_003257 [Monascus purpureus]|uniref:Uncharacterized protein n=1 Tax=Monascus purpureus TaxID=5098 RepID=A0A507QN65_MONPU|nr:hypothetical protein MPDQ_003257 [Monascus purpureus]
MTGYHSPRERRRDPGEAPRRFAELPRVDDRNGQQRVQWCSVPCPVSGNPRSLMQSYLQAGHGLVLGRKDLVPGSDGAGVVECQIPRHFISRRRPPSTEPAATWRLSRNVSGENAFESQLLGGRHTVLLWVNGMSALFGLGSKSPKPGDTVLVQGTGGVSIAALQMAESAPRFLEIYRRIQPRRAPTALLHSMK